ncbi:protein yellow-like [Cydia pomonella]|uniref:protein yellow-like n=1 Tax=Cydia pomonella TaxID=82600 RepID=UPI002ADE5C2D|nr:protein yellow-like [Cydia pomonella]
MAVSHQWFIQWSPPSMILADITSQYNNVNERFNTFDHDRTKWEVNSDDSQTKPVYEPEQSDYGYDTEEKVRNGATQAAGLTLWLTMLGLARAQSIPADFDTPPFSTLYKWQRVDFEFPSAMHRQQAIATGKYIPANVLPLGLEVYGSRVWVTLPAWRRGVPATLATVPRSGGVTSPLLRPYPDWSFHRAFANESKTCSGLTSVFRMNVDACGRLWVLDSGQIDSQDSPKQLCPPSIVVFDLRTDRLIARYKIPKKYVLQDSLFANIIVDTRTKDCSDLHVYIADTWRFGLLVFRQSDATFWRFSNPIFYPDPLASNYTLHGINFQWADGIFGLALSPLDSFGNRLLFFHAMSSYREFFVSTTVLRQSVRVNDSSSDFHLVGESRGLSGQSSASAIDRRGVMFYGLVSRDSIGCWDTQKPYSRKSMGVVAENTETLIFPNDIKVDQEEQQSVWVLSNRLPMFQRGPLNPYDYNYRIMYADTAEAARQTVCDPDVQLPALSYRRLNEIPISPIKQH